MWKEIRQRNSGQSGSRFLREHRALALLNGLAVALSWPVALVFLILYPFVGGRKLDWLANMPPMLYRLLDLVRPTPNCDRVAAIHSVTIEECQTMSILIGFFMLGVFAAVVVQLVSHIVLAMRIRQLALSLKENTMGAGLAVSNARFTPIYWVLCLTVGYLLYGRGYIHVLSLRMNASGEFALVQSLINYTAFNTVFMGFVMLSFLSPVTWLAERMSRRILSIEMFKDR